MAGPRSLLPLWLMLPAILPPLHPSHPLNQTHPSPKKVDELKLSICQKKNVFLHLILELVMSEIRALLPEEQEFVKKLVNLRKNLTEGNLANFHSVKILEQIIKLDFVALVWDISDQDYLFLLEELEHAGYITIQAAKSSSVIDNKRYIYNRKKYQQFEKDSEIFLSRYNREDGILYWEDMNCITFNIGIVNYLERYLNDKLIYPRASLVDYVENKFNTIENRRHKTQNIWNFVTLTLSIIAIMISIIIPTQCSTKIESKDLQRIADFKIQEEVHTKPADSTLNSTPKDTIISTNSVKQ